MVNLRCLPLFLLINASVASAQTESALLPDPGFRHVELYSFGYSLAPAVPGTTGAGDLLSSGPFTVQGLECPYCTNRPLASQTRFVLQPIGQTFTYRPSRRIEIFHTAAVSQVLSPDYVSTRGFLTQNGFRVSEGSKLFGSETGVAVGLDRNRRLWLGGSLRLLQQLSTSGGRGWKTYGGSISFRPAR